jgi:hypothetical protein
MADTATVCRLLRVLTASGRPRPLQHGEHSSTGSTAGLMTAQIIPQRSQIGASGPATPCCRGSLGKKGGGGFRRQRASERRTNVDWVRGALIGTRKGWKGPSLPRFPWPIPVQMEVQGVFCSRGNHFGNAPRLADHHCNLTEWRRQCGALCRCRPRPALQPATCGRLPCLHPLLDLGA